MNEILQMARQTKQLTLLMAALIVIAGFASAQTTRYFEFTTTCGHGNWQDTAFVAATSDQAIIDEVFIELAKPLEERRFISGAIGPGDDGHNRNADHWFLWHFIPDQWSLVDFAIEVCDGCPYTDVDMDTAYWISNLGQFCPWSGRPVRELKDIVDTDDLHTRNEITLYPNPASDVLYLSSKSTITSIVLYNAIGQRVINLLLDDTKATIDVTHLESGLYFLHLERAHAREIHKLVIQK
jgi:hypothetical protein